MNKFNQVRYNHEAQRLIQERINALQRLSFSQAASLTESAEEKMVIEGKQCSLFVLSQQWKNNSILVVVVVARKLWWGLASSHTERGLIFFPDGVVREANSQELMDSGG